MLTSNDRIEGPYSTPEYKQEFYVEEQLNLDLVQALTAANIPLEKSDKLKKFFKKTLQT
ncbi:15386_t:CDS:2, partial [Gigaspora margarita]